MERSEAVHTETTVSFVVVVPVEPEGEVVVKFLKSVTRTEMDTDQFFVEGTVESFNFTVLFWAVRRVSAPLNVLGD